MNAALLVMSSAWIAGADTAPPPTPPFLAAPAPAAGAMALLNCPPGAQCGPGCGGGCGAGCSGACDECPKPPGGSRTSLFGKLRAKLGGGHGGCSACGGYSTHSGTGSSCCGTGGGLFGRHKGHAGGYPEPGVMGSYPVYGGPTGCALPPAPGMIAPTPLPDAPAPKPMTPGPEGPGSKSLGKATQLSAPRAATPVSNPRTVNPPLGTSGSPF